MVKNVFDPLSLESVSIEFKVFIFDPFVSLVLLVEITKVLREKWRFLFNGVPFCFYVRPRIPWFDFLFACSSSSWALVVEPSIGEISIGGASSGDSPRLEPKLFDIWPLYKDVGSRTLSNLSSNRPSSDSPFSLPKLGSFLACYFLIRVLL